MCNFREAAGGQGEDSLALDGERGRVKRHGVGSSGRQCAELRKTFRVVQHADDPQMVEGALGLPRILGLELERHPHAGPVEHGHLIGAQVVHGDRPVQLGCFHHERRQFGDAGAHVQAPAARAEAVAQDGGQRGPEFLARPPPFLPEGVASFVTVDGSQRLVVQAVEDPRDGSERGGLERCHGGERVWCRSRSGLDNSAHPRCSIICAEKWRNGGCRMP